MLAAGHFLILHRFRKRRYAGKMLKNTMEYCRVTDGQGYIAAIEESVKQGVWYYSREWILTKDYMIGKVITDVGFYPVAVPRALITEIVFFRKRPVMNRMRRLDQGILVCCLPGGKPVEFLIGQGARSQRVLKILNYYGIPWQEAPMVYGYGNSM